MSVRTLLRRNFFLHGHELLREGDVLAIDYADEAPLGTLGVNAYAYPYIGGELLDSVLPYLTYLTPFTYGITPAGVLVPLDDARLLERAAHYGAKSLMHLSTLTPEGNFSSENAAALLQNDRAQSALLAEILQTMAKKGYYGLDVDFEYVPPELREDYAAFV
ncbi:MAG: glycoside hydrolase, partial [Oscillospiraceae bacterium]|nr:glycoside hydrolase [Oscillospiraceae bacterium]